MPKKVKTKADQPPQGEKKGTIQCRYCPHSFSRRNCYRHHLVKHKDILYAEKNELQVLLNKQENQSQIRPTTKRKRTSLAPISLNELSITYENSRGYEDSGDYEDSDNNYESYRKKWQKSYTILFKKSVLIIVDYIM